MINILIVDDSPTETLLLKKLFEAEEDMHVIGCAKNGEEAIKMTAELKPDIITMDINMPVMNGYEATRLIMSQHPTPIVVISSAVNNESLNTTFLALDAGALSVLEKPNESNNSAVYPQHKRIVDTIRSMSEIKMITRRFHAPAKIIKPIPTESPARKFEIVAVGVSVGGPQALKNIFSKLPTDFPIPIAVVQHMTPGFMHGFTKWLNQYTQLKIKEAENNEELLPGTIYFAPDHYHFQIKQLHNQFKANLVKGLPVSGFCPSATMLLQSVAKACGQNAVGILLTGMGNDGALGLLDMKKAHAHTIIQDKESAVVFGMAGVAQSLNAADKVIELEKIADYLIKIC